MTKQILVLIVAAGLTSPAWTAERNTAPKEEQIGVGSGFVAGALAGGPIGALVGAAIGGWTGNRFHRERSEKLDAEQRYEQARTDAASLEGMLQARERDLTDLRSEWRGAQRNYRDALQQALDAQVFFRTGQSELDDEASQRLSRIAGLVEEIDDLTIIVEGHADARGDEEYNEQLSAQRAAAVRDALIRAGLSADRITSVAEGERRSTAAEKDLDALALERRVNLSIVDRQVTNRVAQQ